MASPPRAFRCLLLIAVLCSCDRQPQQADHRPAKLPESGLAELRAANRERALFRQLNALRLADQEAKATDHEAQGQVARRWRAYLKTAKGTPYEGIARPRVELCEEDAHRALPALRHTLRQAYIDSDWQGAARAAERFVTRHPDTAAAGRARDWAKRIEHVRSQALTSRLIRVGGNKQAWTKSISSGQTRLTGVIQRGNTLHLNRSGGSRVDVLFNLTVVPKNAEMRIDHVAAYAAGNEYATVDIAVNGAALCIDWCVASKWSTYNRRRHRWPIGKWLKPGQNSITLRLGQSALAIYWLNDLEVRTGNRPSFESLLHDEE